MSIANWNEIAQYLPGDVVYYGPDSYYCLAQNIDVLPPTLAPNWALLNSASFAPSFAEFVSNTTQNLPASTQTPITLDVKNIGTPDIVPSGAYPAPSVRTQTAGTYRVAFSAQLEKLGGGGADEIQLWFARNGGNLPNTNSKVDITQQTNLVMTIEIFVALNAGDSIGLVGYTPAGSVQDAVVAIPVDANHPVSIPSVILTLTRIA